MLAAVVGLSGTTALGFWQYARAHRDDISRQVLTAPAVPVDRLVAPGNYVPESAFAHAVSVTGVIHGKQALSSCGRAEVGQGDGCWIIAPVTIKPGLAITVVLGFAESALVEANLEAVQRALPSPTTLTGRLQPAEIAERGRAILRPSTSIDAINVNELAIRWQTDLLDGYVVLDPAYQGITPTAALITPPSGITWRNLIYAWQWWAFAAFVLFLLTRYIIDVRAEAPTLSQPDHSKDPS